MKESAVQRKCIDAAEALGFEVRKVVAVSHEAFPDLFLTHKDTGPMLVEVKRPDTVDKDDAHARRQAREGTRLANNGTPTYKVADEHAMRLLLWVALGQERPPSTVPCPIEGVTCY